MLFHTSTCITSQHPVCSRRTTTPASSRLKSSISPARPGCQQSWHSRRPRLLVAQLDNKREEDEEQARLDRVAYLKRLMEGGEEQRDAHKDSVRAQVRGMHAGGRGERCLGFRVIVGA